jgi:hypothetical protein
MVRPWENIKESYTKLVQGGLPLHSMLQLVIEIEHSKFASGLHAWTSMHDLCIVQVPVTFPNYYPYLRISPKTDDRLEFRYIDTLIKNRQWTRTVEGERGFARLELFIRQLNWFTDI